MLPLHFADKHAAGALSTFHMAISDGLSVLLGKFHLLTTKQELTTLATKPTTST